MFSLCKLRYMDVYGKFGGYERSEYVGVVWGDDWE